jgi:hypothetical protein
VINVFYTDRFIKPWAAGCARGPLVFIRPTYKDDVGLHEYEQTHVRQFWRTFGLHSLFYRFSEEYRFRAEAEAYHRQYLRNPERLALFASFVVTNYDIKVSQAEAAAAIKYSP